jgi:hypothetical protein
MRENDYVTLLFISDDYGNGLLNITKIEKITIEDNHVF